MPLSSNLDIIPDTMMTAAHETVTPEVTPASTDKELSVMISSSDVKHCKPQKARRGKHLLGPNRQDDRKTLAVIKKTRLQKKSVKM